MSYDKTRYKEVKKLGTGGFSTVYLVKDLFNNGKLMALKEIKAVKVNKKNITRLQDEFIILNSLKHKNLVDVYDIEFNEKDSSVFYTMEYCKKTNILAFLRKKSEKEVVLALVQILRALFFIHTNDIIHFDIKPENFGIVEDLNGFTVKLMDFGLFLPRSQIKKSSIRGTLQYMAPELFTKDNKDHRLDIFSLGMVFLRLLLLRNRIKKTDKYLDFSKLTEEEIAKIKEQRLLTIIEKMVKPKQNERFANAYKVLEQINLLYRKNYEIIPTEDKSTLFFEPKFTGRDSELSYLQGILCSAELTDKAIFVNIKGESGIGKSRLIREFRINTQLKGYKIKEAQCAKGGKLLEVVISLIQKMMPEIDTNFFYKYEESVVEFYKKTVFTSASNLTKYLVKLRDKDKSVADNYYYHIAKLFDDLLSREPEDKPVIFIVHDIHNIDEFSANLLKSFCHKNSNIIFVFSIKTDREYKDYIKLLLSEVSATGNYEEVYIKSLSSGDVVRLIDTTFPSNNFDKTFYKFVFEKTVGNPLLITEIFKSLIETGDLKVEDGKWHCEKELSENASIMQFTKNILHYRLLSLGYEELSIVKVISVVGQGVPLLLLQKVMPGQNITESILEGLIEKRILKKVREKYIFHHSAFIDATSSFLDRETEIKIARSIAEFNEKYKFFPSELTGDLFLKGDLKEKAIAHYKKALSVNKRVYRNNKVIEIGNKAFALETDRKKKVEILELLIETSFYLGNIKLSESYINEYKNFVDSFKRNWQICKYEVELFAKKGKVNRARERLFDFYNANKKYLENLNNLFYVYITLATLFFNEGDIVNAELYLNLAESFSLKDSYKNIASIFTLNGKLKYIAGDYENAEKYWNRAGKLYRINGFLPGLSVYFNNMATIELSRGNFGQAEDYLQKAIKIQNDIGNYRQLIFSYSLLAEIYMCKGKLNSAFTYINRAENYNKLANDVWSKVFLVTKKTKLLIIAGAYVEASNELLLGEIMLTETGYRKEQCDIDFLNAQMALQRGKLQEAYKIINTVVDRFKSMEAMEFYIEAKLLKTTILRKAVKVKLAYEELKSLEKLIKQSTNIRFKTIYYYERATIKRLSSLSSDEIVSDYQKAIQIATKYNLKLLKTKVITDFILYYSDILKEMGVYSEHIKILDKDFKDVKKSLPPNYTESFKHSPFFVNIFKYRNFRR